MKSLKMAKSSIADWLIPILSPLKKKKKIKRTLTWRNS